MMRFTRLLLLAAIAIVPVLAAGCTNSGPPAEEQNPPAAEGKGHGHETPHADDADEKDRKLYLTPGGKYTEADIKANGGMTAAQKFKEFKARHDLKPKPGNKICPVTLTKANPQCTWIINGKKYEFCCPPCVDEFVSQAKDPQTAKELKEPEEYRKR